MASWEPSYKDDLDWLQFAYTGYTKGVYMAPPKTAFSFAMTAEGEALFLPVLKRFRNLYPRAYAKGAMSMNPLGLGGGELELGKRNHTA